MRGSLAGERLKLFDKGSTSRVAWKSAQSASAEPATWYRTSFTTPAGVADGTKGTQLLLNVDGLQRGRIWLNGHEIGRYWTLQRNDGSACPFGKTACPTQQFYHLPASWLSEPGESNHLVLFEVLGAVQLGKVGLATAKMQPGMHQVDPTKVASCEF